MIITKLAVVFAAAFALTGCNDSPTSYSSSVHTDEVPESTLQAQLDTATPITVPSTSTRTLQGVWRMACRPSGISTEDGLGLYHQLELAIGPGRFTSTRNNWTNSRCNQPYAELTEQSRSGSFEIERWVAGAQFDQLHLVLRIADDYGIENNAVTESWLKLRDGGIVLDDSNGVQAQFHR